jgi:hypothetical protein
MINVIQGVPFVFYGEVFTAYLADDRQWYISLNDVCQALGVDANGQRQRIQRDEAISDRLAPISIETPYQNTTRIQEVSCLNLRALPYWLGTIDAARVKEEHRKKVVLFKREFAEAAWAVFRSDIIPSDMLAEMDAHLPPGEREYHEAIDQMLQARRKLDLLSGRLDEELARIGADLGDVLGRLGSLEAELRGRQIVNSAQSKLLQDMIAAVALALHERARRPKSQCFAEVHDEFKTAFQIPIYSFLPAEQLQAAVTYLGSRWAYYNPGQPLPEIFRGSNQPSLF